MSSVNNAMNKEEATRMKNALAKLQVDLPTYVRYMGTMAVLHRAKYVGLLNEGFSKEEALELCKNLMSL